MTYAPLLLLPLLLLLGGSVWLAIHVADYRQRFRDQLYQLRLHDDSGGDKAAYRAARVWLRLALEARHPWVIGKRLREAADRCLS